MRATVLAVLTPVWIALGVGAPAWAHHSFAAAYDTTQSVEVHGVIAQVRLENPHSWFFIEARDASGNVEKWAKNKRKSNAWPVKNGPIPRSFAPF